MLKDDVLHSEILLTLKMAVTLSCKNSNMFLDNILVFGSTDLLILILVMIDLTVYSMSSRLETCTRTFKR